VVRIECPEYMENSCVSRTTIVFCLTHPKRPKDFYVRSLCLVCVSTVCGHLVPFPLQCFHRAGRSGPTKSSCSMRSEGAIPISSTFMLQIMGRTGLTDGKAAPSIFSQYSDHL